MAPAPLPPIVVLLSSVLMCNVGLTVGSRILLIGATSSSHLNPLITIGNELINRNHEVHVALPSKFSHTQILKKSSINKITWESSGVDPNAPASESAIPDDMDLVSDFLGDRYGDHVWLFQDEAMMELDLINCKDSFNDNNFVMKLGGMKFDLAIVDGFQPNRCFYALMYKFSIPYISSLSGGEPWMPRMAYLPSFVPNFYTSFTEKMTLVEKMKNTIAYVTWSLPALFPAYNDTYVSHFVPEKPFVTLDELYAKSELWFIAGSPMPLDYPRPAMPHVVDVSGLNTKPPKPLPESLAKFMDSHRENGVILVSFGSIITKLPDPVLNPLLQAFLKIDQAVVFRYSSKIDMDLPSRIKIMKWLPQNDILGHPNTRVFITHCGNNGQMEAVYNAVPMIGIPIWADQLYNCKRIEYNGYGACMDLRYLHAKQIVGNIKQLTQQKEFSARLKKASLIFKDRLNSPLETAVFWVEHVLKFGSKHLRSRMLDMPWYEVYMLDIYVVCTITLLISVLLLHLIIRLLSRKCLSNNSKLKQN